MDDISQPSNSSALDQNLKMLFFKCCTICKGDLLLEADKHQASLKCLGCGNTSSVPANTHLFDVLCEEPNCDDIPHGFEEQRAA